MAYLEISELGNGLHEVKINRPKANALNHDVIKELSSCFDGLSKDSGNKGTILTGTYPFFSAGLDVVELYSYDKDKMQAFWNDFQTMIINMLSYNKPLVAAISGHSPAGGCIMALCADYRIMTSGKNRIGLNEAAVSIVIPKAVRSLYASVIGLGEANKALMRGSLFTAEQALNIGLVDEVKEADELASTALSQVQKFVGMPALAWSASKSILRKPLLNEFKSKEASGFEDAANYWWEEDCRNFIAQMIASLKKGKQ